MGKRCVLGNLGGRGALHHPGSMSFFWVLRDDCSFGAWLRRPGGQGGFRPPPYAPLDPLYPLQTAEGYPRTPLVPPRARPLVSRPTGAVSGTPFGLAWGQQPIGCRGGHALCMAPDAGARTAAQVVLPWRHLAYTPRIDRCRGAGGGISCAEGDSGPPRDGCEPSWARPCEASGALLLSNGGSGGGHETCTLWPPPAPFGYFPVWESTSSARRRTKPPTRNRFLAKGKEKGLTFFFLFRKEISPLRRRPGGFPLAPWTPSGPILICVGKTSHEKQTSCRRQEKALPFFFPYRKGFRLCGGDQRAFRSPFGNLRPFAAHGGFHKKQIPCGRQEKSLPCFILFRGRVSPLRRRPGGFPLAPWTPSGERALRIALFSNKTIRPAGTRRGAVPYAFSGGSPQTLSLPLPMLLA